MIMADDNLGSENLFAGNFESQYKEEIEELFTKIKAGDSSDQAVREYTDYRTYLDYDIEITKKTELFKSFPQRQKATAAENHRFLFM